MSSQALHVPNEAGQWPVPRDWSRLDELCLGIWDCPHSTPKLSDKGPLVVRSQDIRTGVFRTAEAARVTEETYEERIARAEPRIGDLLYSREGTYFGIAAEMPRDERVCLGQRMVLIRPDPDALNSRFLRMWLNSPVLARHIHGFRDGTVAERLNMPTIRGLPVPRFTKLEQKWIAELVGQLDDKIELNRQTSETLEALARAIFKDWFVDFGPTRAKAEGVEPYLSSELWDLFPPAFDDDDKPVGWTISEIGKEVRAVGGATPSTKEPAYWDGGEHHWATPKDLSKLSAPVLLDTDRKITDAGINKISSGLLPIGTLLLSSRAPIGYLAIAEVPTAVNQGFIAMECNGRLSNVFVLFWCYENLDYIKGISGGSTFAEISKKTFRPIPITVPSAEVLQAFDSIVQPLYRQIVANIAENTTLAETRDLMLPKLMSGDIRLRDAEKSVEAIA